jgi:hypothetical protein
MTVDKTGDNSCHVWLAPLSGRLEGFQIGFLHCVGRPFVAMLEVVE